MVLSESAATATRERPRNIGRRGGGVGRDRDFDDSIPLLGQSIQIADEGGRLSDAIHDTVSQGMSNDTRRNYRNRLDRIIKYWKEHINEYYVIGVREVSEEEQRDRSKYYFGKKQDLVYRGLNVDFVICFLSETNKRGDGKFKSFDDLRKYRDAILWGAKMAHELLPSSFYRETEVFLSAYKKKIAAEKKKVMLKSSRLIQSHCQCIDCCCVDPLKQTTFSHGCGLCCNGTVWLEALP